MTRPRSNLVCIEETPYYHCHTRCVRKARLCGIDESTGKDYSYRRQWIVDLFTSLSSVFAIDICAYAVMSNHYHLIIHIDKARAAQWSSDEVIRRWREIRKGDPLLQRYVKGERLSIQEQKKLSKAVEECRQKLWDISTFFSILNFSIARQANYEDQCTGHFWQARFASHALKTSTDLIRSMSYVDLNPVRAGIANSLEDSDYTSVQQRLFAIAKQKKQHKPFKPTSVQPQFLMPLLSAEHADETLSGIYFDLEEYIELVEWTGRAVVNSKPGSICKQRPSILTRINLSPSKWLKYFENKPKPATKPPPMLFRQAS